MVIKNETPTAEEQKKDSLGLIDEEEDLSNLDDESKDEKDPTQSNVKWL